MFDDQLTTQLAPDCGVKFCEEDSSNRCNLTNPDLEEAAEEPGLARPLPLDRSSLAGSGLSIPALTMTPIQCAPAAWNSAIQAQQVRLGCPVGRRLMRAVERWLGIPEQWQEPFLQFIYRFV